MFKVPNDPDNPTYRDTFKVGFIRWLTSSKADRQEWQRRRNGVGQARVARAQAAHHQAQAAHSQAKQQHRAAKREAKQRIKRTLKRR